MTLPTGGLVLPHNSFYTYILYKGFEEREKKTKGGEKGEMEVLRITK